MSYIAVPYWDLTSTIIYCLMGLLPVWTIYKTDNFKSNQSFVKNRYYWVWLVIWVVFASYRYIGYGLGGSDARAYLIYFEHCFNADQYHDDVVSQYNSNVGFRWYNQLLYLISNKDRFYLIVTYSILSIGIIYFINFFKLKKESCLPYFLTVFLYIRGFSTIRSNLAITVLLLSFCLLANKKYISSVLLALFASSIHTMIILYALFIPFYLFSLRRKKISYKLILVVFMGLFLVILPIRTLFLQNINFLGSSFSEHYEDYVNNVNNSFFVNAWKIAFEQLLLFAFMLFNKNNLTRYENSLDNKQKVKFDFIWKLCLYDFLLVPICYALNIWRGYEVLYVPRLVMWAILVYIGSTKCTKRFVFIYALFVFCLFLCWFLQRTSAKSFWQETSLMPYLFEPLID